jgi:hypothetical protein
MAKFIYGTALSLCIENMIKNANQYLFLISPYIKLHDRIKDELKKKKPNEKLQIVIVFGKNEEDRSKSLSNEDLNFLKDFPNILICYEKNLHAKYYASESSSLITSMNLHQFSQNSNVEVGVEMFPKSFVGSLADTIKQISDCDTESINYFQTVIENSEKLFVKTPEYEARLFKKKYINSIVQVDKLREFFYQKKSDYKSTSPNSFNQYTKSSSKPLREKDNFKPGQNPI